MKDKLSNMELKCILCDTEKNLKQISEYFICYLCFEEQKQQNQKIQKERKIFDSEINQITDKIFLGNYDGQRESDKLKHLGITSILAIGTHLEDLNAGQFEFLQLDLYDFENENLLKILKKALLYIDESKCVYVHCHAGISRSASVVIAYIMWKNQIQFELARKLVSIKRPSIFPNPGFKTQLLAFEKLLEDNQYNLNFLE